MSSLTGRLFGHYRILERIGRGGMATVYHADDRKSGRDVAVKFISPALAENEDFLKRFRREVKLVARLDHPNIVPVYDYGEQEGYAYLVMPYLPVGSLTDRMKQAPISLDEGGKLLGQVAVALDYAHRQGIVHRDVKPANILLDAEGNALLADFGLARSHEATLSLTGSALIGTPAYIAPEQVKGEQVDSRCDQYSLGVILFQLASGTLPFEASTPIALALKHLSDPFPSARSRSPNVPESVDRVILRATAKDPAERFETVSEMNGALQAALAYVRDPLTHRAPTIELPRAGVAAPTMPTPISRSRRARAVRIGAVASAILLVVLALPVFASGLLELMGRAAKPAEGGAATIAAMSTELASAPGPPLQQHEIETAVVQTLAVSGGFDLTAPDGPTATPGVGPAALLGPSATPASGTPPFSPSASLTVGPGSPVPPIPPPATPVPSGTPSPTSPSQTPTSSATRTPTLTSTPSITPSRTATQLPSPAPTEDTCARLSLGGFVVDEEGGIASWVLTNASVTTVTITRIVLDWPADNLVLDRVRFDGASIWNETDASPPSNIESGWTGEGNRKLEAASSKSLRFVFGADAQASGYDVLVHLDVGCQVPGGG